MYTLYTASLYTVVNERHICSSTVSVRQVTTTDGSKKVLPRRLSTIERAQNREN